MKDEQKFKEAYDTHVDGIFRFCYFRTGDRETAKELTQESFLKTWEALGKGTKIDSLKSYLYRVAHNLLVNKLRARKEIVSLDDEENLFEPVDEEMDSPSLLSEENLLAQNIGKLHKSYAEVLKLKLSNDLTIREIADILGKSENNVAVLIHRATENLRKNYYNEN